MRLLKNSSNNKDTVVLAVVIVALFELATLTGCQAVGATNVSETATSAFSKLKKLFGATEHGKTAIFQ